MDNLITNESIIALALRVILGLMFVIQGYDKLFNVGMRDVVTTVNQEYIDKGFPDWLVALISYFTTYVEFLGGIMLILGLFKMAVAYTLLLDITIVCFGMSILNPVWDMKYVWPRLVMLIAIILIPEDWDKLCIDYFNR